MKLHLNALLLIGVIILMSSCGKIEVKEDIKLSSYFSNATVHDPSIVQDENGLFYIFGSHMDTATSEDLLKWEQFSSGVTKYSKLFDNLFDGEKEAFKFVGRNDQGGFSVWAPDVIYNKELKKWFMYFCTTSSYIKSSLAYATADSIEGPYSYQGTIIYSGFTRKTIGETNVLDYVDEDTARKRYLNFSSYNNQEWPNAIDPALFYDTDGRLWMTYGSWSGGMFILEIDESTGLPIHPELDEENRVDPYFGKKLAGGLHNSIEGPYIMYSPESDYYYMFVSYGSLVTKGGYQIRQYRSKNPDGPYLDASGRENIAEVFHNDFGLKMMGNYNLPTLTKAYMAPGHNSAIRTEDGKHFLVFHTRFDDGGEFHEPRVHQMFLNREGWLVASPFVYDKDAIYGEELDKPEIKGAYYVVNHGKDVSDKIQESEQMFFKSFGKITNADGEKVGTWTLEKENSGITLQIGEDVYTGVVVEQLDEAGNRVLCITAAGINNQTVWAVQYL